MTMLRWGGWILLVCLTAPTAAQVINDNYFCRVAEALDAKQQDMGPFSEVIGVVLPP